MKKIIVDKAEGIAEVIDSILNEPDADITLVIPKASALGRSVSNFHLLKREADAAGRRVAIESVDEGILAFAKESRLESNHPLWRGVRGTGGVSDIIPKSYKQDDGEEETPRVTRKVTKKAAAPVVEEEPEEVEEEDELVVEEEEVIEEPRTSVRSFFSGRTRSDSIGMKNLDATDDDAEHNNYDNEDDDDNAPSRRVSRKLVVAGIIALILIFAGAYIASAFFNHATVSIVFKKTPWSDQTSLTADKSISSDNLAGNMIAAQIFTSNKNVTQSYPGSSIQTVSQKAQGTITIYNDYSTSPQQLVATTRFLTPDGKIFRITQDVTVPGATMTGSTLTPSSVQAPIVADQAGPDYNIGPVAKLTIPGFAGKPQETGFYGTITASTTGGFIGQRAAPTDADIAAAKASTTALLQASLQGGFSGSYPNNFKILDGATMIQITKLTVNTSTDDKGNFTVFGQATLQAIGFDESALKNDLLAQAQVQNVSSTFSDLTISYSNVQANFTKGQVSFSLSAQGDLEPAFTASTFEDEILGKSISDARSAIGALPQLDSGTISVWPSWLWTMPSSPDKVKINVD